MYSNFREFSNNVEYDYAFNISDNSYTDCTWFIEYMLNRFEDALTDAITGGDKNDIS